MPCDFIKVGLYQEHFQKNIGTLLFLDRYSTKNYEALYLWNKGSLCSTVFEYDKHIMITMLNNQMEDICFESIHADKKKTKI